MPKVQMLESGEGPRGKRDGKGRWGRCCREARVLAEVKFRPTNQRREGERESHQGECPGSRQSAKALKALRLVRGTLKPEA